MRGFFRIVGLAVLCILGSVAVVVTLAYSMGTVTVSVHEKKLNGDQVYVPVPAVVIPLAMRLVRTEDLADAAAEVRPWLPAIKVAAEELAHCTDTTLVEVTNHAENVAISKSGGSIIIDVDSPEERVHVSVPLGAAYMVAAQLERLDEKPVAGD